MALIGDITSMLNIGAVLVLIVAAIMFGHVTGFLGTFGLGAIFGSGLAYLVTILKFFQPLFGILNFIPVIGIFLKDMPDIIGILVNEFTTGVAGGSYSVWLGRAMWGMVFGINIDVARKLLSHDVGAAGKLAIIALVSFMFLMTFMLMAYQLSGTGCAFVDSLCQINKGIYPTLIPIILIASFIVNIIMFFYPIVVAFTRGGSTDALKENLKDIAFAVVAVGFMSYRVWIPIAAGLTGNQATILNLW